MPVGGTDHSLQLNRRDEKDKRSRLKLRSYNHAVPRSLSFNVEEAVP